MKPAEFFAERKERERDISAPVLPGFNFAFVFQEEVDVIEGIFKTIFLVAVDIEMLLEVAGRIGDGLVGEVNHHVHLRISLDVGKELLKEGFTDHNWKDEVIEFVLLVDIGKETAHDDAETVASNGPGGVFAARPATEVLACHENGARISGVVEHKVFLRAVGVIAPVAEKIVAKARLVGGFEETRRDDLVGVDVLQRERHAGAVYDVEFLFHNTQLKKCAWISDDARHGSGGSHERRCETSASAWALTAFEITV